MNRLRIIILLSCLTFAVPAQAGLVETVGRGLLASGFNIDGQRNIITDGGDIIINRLFQNETLDFGVGDLTMQGPISLEVAAGRRPLPTLDIQFQTAVTGDAPSQPLNYQFNLDSGNQRTQVTGNLLIDGSLSLNGFGFYDLQFNYSSRQTVDRDGRFSNSLDEFDSDLGPINIRGNVIADVLAVVTEPIWEGAGVENPFASFSGNAQLAELLGPDSDSLLARVAGGLDPLGDNATDPLRGATLADPAATRGFGLVHSSAIADAPVPATVPEPASLLLLLTGVPALVRRRG